MTLGQSFNVENYSNRLVVLYYKLAIVGILLVTIGTIEKAT